MNQTCTDALLASTCKQNVSKKGSVGVQVYCTWVERAVGERGAHSLRVRAEQRSTEQDGSGSVREIGSVRNMGGSEGSDPFECMRDPFKVVISRNPGSHINPLIVNCISYMI